MPKGMLFTAAALLHPEESLFQYRKSGESLDLRCNFQERKRLRFPVTPASPSVNM